MFIFVWLDFFTPAHWIERRAFKIKGRMSDLIRGSLHRDPLRDIQCWSVVSWLDVSLQDVASR